MPNPVLAKKIKSEATFVLTSLKTNVYSYSNMVTKHDLFPRFLVENHGTGNG